MNINLGALNVWQESWFCSVWPQRLLRRVSPCGDLNAPPSRRVSSPLVLCETEQVNTRHKNPDKLLEIYSIFLRDITR